MDRALTRAPGRVMDYSTHFGAYLAAYGWPMLAGTQTSPDLALFRFLARLVGHASRQGERRECHGQVDGSRQISRDRHVVHAK